MLAVFIFTPLETAMQRFTTFIVITLFAAALFPSCASGQVIISEIMYNPDSREGTIGQDAKPNQTEWLEIYNTGDEEVSLAGWCLRDEDGQTATIPEGIIINPGEAVVLIPGSQTIEDFRAAWDADEAGFTVIPLDGWGMGQGTLDNLGNSPSDTNEIVTLINHDDQVIDAVNYDDEGDWPSDSPDGASLVLKPDKLDAESNDSGSNWTLSTEGENASRKNTQTEDYNGEDLGSPGQVQVE